MNKKGLEPNHQGWVGVTRSLTHTQIILSAQPQGPVLFSVSPSVVVVSL